MRDLFIALKSLYDATTSASFVASPEWTAAEILTAAQALRTYCVGGIHMPKAPHGTPTPHLTMSATADLTEGSMGYIPREGTVVTFSLWTARYGLDAALLQMNLQNLLAFSLRRQIDREYPVKSARPQQFRRHAGDAVHRHHNEGAVVIGLGHVAVSKPGQETTR